MTQQISLIRSTFSQSIFSSSDKAIEQTNNYAVKCNINKEATKDLRTHLKADPRVYALS